jgi:hypothetical protein
VAGTREHDVQIGRLRAEARKAEPQSEPLTLDEERAERRQQARDQQFAAELPGRTSVLAHLSAPAALRRAFENLLLTEHRPTIEACSAILEDRIHALTVRGPRSNAQHHLTEQSDLLALKMSVDQWRKAHPCVLDRIRRWKTRGDAAIGRLRYSAGLYGRFYGIDPVSAHS